MAPSNRFMARKQQKFQWLNILLKNVLENYSLKGYADNCPRLDLELGLVLGFEGRFPRGQLPYNPLKVFFKKYDLQRVAIYFLSNYNFPF